MSVEALHDVLTASSAASVGEIPAAAVKLLGAPGRGVRRGLLGSLFSTQQLHPVRRPHSSDEVVANLHRHASAELRPTYLSDTARLRELAAKLVLPVHACADGATAAAARECTPRPLDGTTFVAALERWVALGHISVDESDGGRARLNATRVLETYATQFNAWVNWQCREMTQIIDKAARRLGSGGCQHQGCPRIASKLNEKLQNFGRSAISHMVDRREFWLLPGQVATFTERASMAEAKACVATLEAAGRKHGLNLTGAISTKPLEPVANAESTAAAEAERSAAAAARDPQATVATTSAAAKVSAPDEQAVQTAVDAAIDDYAASLKSKARAAAVRISASVARKNKPKAARPAAIAKRAMAQALASASGSVEQQESSAAPAAKPTNTKKRSKKSAAKRRRKADGV